MSYVDNIDKRIKDYFELLEADFPLWLNDYIETKGMLHQQYISLSCGTCYSKLYNHDIFYSSLDHSIGVALIVWHFTHDKKETIAGLFHDIATPVFKHCVDYLNGDYLKQESTEEETTRIIENSHDIMRLLYRDNLITVSDLYLLKESEVIDIINKSKYKDVFNYWRCATIVKVSNDKPKDVYWVNVGSKIRYINPLCNGERMSSACKLAKKMIDKNLSYDMKKYVYLDFNIDLLDD